MEKFIIKGGKKLSGEIKVGGAKNAALKFFAAALLSKELWQLRNVPNIEDIVRMGEILSDLGVEVNKKGENGYDICASNIKSNILDEDKTRKLRASIVLTVPLLLRTGKAEFHHPGGCLLGKRPIDIFLDGFKAFGANVKWSKNKYIISAKKIRGADFFFRQISVTATETLMMLGVMAQGRTVLKNAAQEPEIQSLAEFLNKCGAKIKGAGTSTIIIDGVKEIRSGIYETMPDRIEAGSFAILAAATNSNVKIKKMNPAHLEVLWQIFKEIGVNFSLGNDYAVVGRSKNNYKAINIKTHEYPGLATDIQPPLTVLLTQLKGLSMVHETIYEGRLFYTDILNKMGANIILCDPHRVVISGPTVLSGAKVFSPDIRAGIALIIAGLMAKGETIIENIYQIDRGYEKIDERLRAIGADIKRVSD